MLPLVDFLFPLSPNYPVAETVIEYLALVGTRLDVWPRLKLLGRRFQWKLKILCFWFCDPGKIIFVRQFAPAESVAIVARVTVLVFERIRIFLAHIPTGFGQFVWGWRLSFIALPLLNQTSDLLCFAPNALQSSSLCFQIVALLVSVLFYTW